MKIKKILIGILILFLLFNYIFENAISSKIKVENSNITSKDDLIIEMDCFKTNGIIKKFNEINCGPKPNQEVKDAVDLKKQYNDIGINFIRTHDFNGPTDISTIFPDFNADPKYQENYYFDSSDIYIKSIIDTGCRVFFRLGESASANESLRQLPENYSKWAEICKHIIMHYNEGWNNGFYYNIKYFEIWNEPDLIGFWNGTSDDYYKLYEITVQCLKSYNPNLKIGGPCTSSLNNINYTHNFLKFLKEKNLSLDFFSWHMYANNPDEIFNASIQVRNMLDEYGFYNTENINTEWNYNILSPQRDKDNSKNAAFTTCTLIAFQNAEIDHAFRYRGTQDNNWLMRFIGLDLSLFTYDGLFKTPALAYKIMNIIEKDSKIRLEIEKTNSKNDITYLGGISEDKSNITIIISNFQPINNDYKLSIKNIPFNNSYEIYKYIIDDESNFIIKENITYNKSSIKLNETIHSYSINFYRITNSTNIPIQGPSTAIIPPILKMRLFDLFGQLLGILLMLIFFT